MSYGGNDRGPTLNAVTWAFTGLGIVMTGLRLVSRAMLTKNFGLDDALIILAVLITICFAASTSAAISAGYGKHLYDIPLESRSLAVYGDIIQSVLAVWTFSIPKLAILALLTRLLSLSLWTSIIFWFLSLGLVGCSCLLSVFWWVQCSPREHQWNPMVPGSCWNPSVVENLSCFVAAFSAFLDFLFAVYPPFFLAKLNMPLHKRIVISLALGGGFVAGAVAIYKETLVAGISKAGKEDPTFASVPLILWTIEETNTLIFVADLPTIGPFVRYLRATAVKVYTSGSSRPSNKPVRSDTVWPGERSAPKWKIWGASTSITARLSSQDDIHLVDRDVKNIAGSGRKVNEEAPPMTTDLQSPGHNEILRTVEIEAIPDHQPTPAHRDPELGLPDEVENQRQGQLRHFRA